MLTRITLQLLLLPLLILVLPLMFALAWIHETASDLASRV